MKKKKKKKKERSTHICYTKCKDILSHNYFSVLVNEFEFKKNNMSADEMVDKFLVSSNKISKSIKVFVPSNLKGFILKILLKINI